jgi:hypothetical protein
VAVDATPATGSGNHRPVVSMEHVEEPGAE